jgi:DNA-binding transcriptional MerR regulator
MRTEGKVKPMLAIGDVAAEVGLPTSALRYYEEAGVLPPPVREGGKRRYSPQTIDLLLLIRFCQRAGFSLAEVRRLLASPTGHQAKTRWRAQVDGKLAEVDAVIKDAHAVMRILKESRDCDCVTLASCSFLRNERRLPRPARRGIRTRAI